MILLEQAAQPITPVGIILIVGFVVILVLCIVHDKKKLTQFIKDTDAKFADKIVEKIELKSADCFITTDKEIVLRPYGGGEYIVCELEDVEFVYGGWNMTAKLWDFILLDEKKKSVKGERFCSGKKNAGKGKMSIFCKSKDDAAALCEFVMKNESRIKLHQIK